MGDKIGSFIQIQNFSVNDGEGIRTVLFLAGCPLRCRWCANPEGFTDSSKIAYYKNICIKCGRCAEVCTFGVGIDLSEKKERQKCKACSRCVEVCPTGSRKNLVSVYNVDEILKIIERQKIFYRFLGGGVTFSGGEPTMQREFLEEIVEALYDQSISMTIETSGYFNFADVKHLLSKLDLIFIDIKHMNDRKHVLYTGVSNELILSNIKKLKVLNVPVVVRVPVIDGVNADVDNIRRTAAFVAENIPQPKMELLPYHEFGRIKYESLGMEVPPENFQTPLNEHLEMLKEIVKSENVEIVSYT